jgi:proteasome lid subunit RPN8/RPN11
MMMFPQQRRRRRELVFSPLAFLKLQYLCHAGPTEVGAFAISSTQRPLYIEELHTLPQQTSSVSVQFDDAAVADYFDRCVDQGYHPSMFARLWLHTHPGSCPRPSGTDEETFHRVFKSSDWAVMAIISRTGNTYARLQLNQGPGARCSLRWRVDWSPWPQVLQQYSLMDLEAMWQEEYQQNIHPQQVPALTLPLWTEIDQWHAYSHQGDFYDAIP